MSNSDDINNFKESAHKMHAYLVSKGINVAFGDVLESVSMGFGVRNWRTMREKLNQLSDRSISVEAGPRWMVHGTYLDNAQPFSDYVEGSTLEQAFINAQVITRNDLSLTLHSLQDLTVPGAPMCDVTNLTRVGSFGWVLQSLWKTANSLREFSVRQGIGVEEAESLDRLNVCLEILEVISKEKLFSDVFGVNLQDEATYVPEPTFSFEDSRGIVWEALKGAEVVSFLLNFVNKVSPLQIAEGHSSWCYVDVCQAMVYAAEDLNFLMAQRFNAT